MNLKFRPNVLSGIHNYRFFQTKSIYLAIVRQFIFVLTKITCIYIGILIFSAFLVEFFIP